MISTILVRLAVLLSGMAVVLMPAPGQRRAQRDSARDREDQTENLPATDLMAAIDATVRKITASDEFVEEDFRTLVGLVQREHWQRGLPRFWEQPESIYSKAEIAFRKECYGRLLEDPKVQQSLRALAADPAPGAISATAMLLLGDIPSIENVAALLTAYVEERRGFRTAARQIGRSLAVLGEQAIAGSPVLSRTMAVLKQDAMAMKPDKSGIALEALARAGETELVTNRIRKLARNCSEPLAAMDVLVDCARLFQCEDFPKDALAECIALALELAAGAWREEAENPSALAIISPRATRFQSAVRYLSAAAPELSMPFFVQCLLDERGTRLLGLDGLQRLRFALQQVRRDLDPLRRFRLDATVARRVYEDGRRLFDLEEIPMHQEEYRKFRFFREVRYNLVSYLNWAVVADADLERWLVEDEDFLEYVSALVLAKDEVFDSDHGELLYYSIREKVETRLMCCRMLALIQRDHDLSLSIDLAAETMQILIGEIDGFDEVGVVLSNAEDLKAALETGLELPIVRMPQDEFVLGQSLATLRLLGYDVRQSRDSIRVRLREAEIPAAGGWDEPGQ